jgi:hypothetical protein
LTASSRLASPPAASVTQARWSARGLRLLEQREREDQAKIELLRAAAKEGFDDIERGDYVTLRSDKEIDDFIDRLGEDASAEFAAGQNRA